jgi:hypothetical protein
MNGINYVSNEKAEIKAIILDLELFKQEGILATSVIQQLSNLQDMISNAPAKNKKNTTSWEEAKKALDKLK